jgi:hypothetical protein
MIKGGGMFGTPPAYGGGRIILCAGSTGIGAGVVPKSN